MFQVFLKFPHQNRPTEIKRVSLKQNKKRKRIKKKNHHFDLKCLEIGFVILCFYFPYSKYTRHLVFVLHGLNDHFCELVRSLVWNIETFQLLQIVQWMWIVIFQHWIGEVFIIQTKQTNMNGRPIWVLNWGSLYLICCCSLLCFSFLFIWFYLCCSFFYFSSY